MGFTDFTCGDNWRLGNGLLPVRVVCAHSRSLCTDRVGTEDETPERALDEVEIEGAVAQLLEEADETARAAVLCGVLMAGLELAGGICTTADSKELVGMLCTDMLLGTCLGAANKVEDGTCRGTAKQKGRRMLVVI